MARSLNYHYTIYLPIACKQNNMDCLTKTFQVKGKIKYIQNKVLEKTITDPGHVTSLRTEFRRGLIIWLNNMIWLYFTINSAFHWIIHIEYVPDLCARVVNSDFEKDEIHLTINLIYPTINKVWFLLWGIMYFLVCFLLYSKFRLPIRHYQQVMKALFPAISG